MIHVYGAKSDTAYIKVDSNNFYVTEQGCLIITDEDSGNPIVIFNKWDFACRRPVLSDADWDGVKATIRTDLSSSDWGDKDSVDNGHKV